MIRSGTAAFTLTGVPNMLIEIASSCELLNVELRHKMAASSA
jgi:hypothetical protein